MTGTTKVPSTPDTPEPTALSCRSLGVELGSGATARRVLDDVVLEVRAGEFVSIMGRSGIGKTTLLRVLGGLLQPEAGSDVRCHDRPVIGPPEGVVTVFQNYAASLLPWRTIARNVALGVEADLTREECRERVADALEMVGLGDRAGDHPWRLSGGMQQRVQLARALATRPTVLLMDEPFGALDATTKAGLEDELLAIQAKTAATIVFVTHDIDEAVYLSDRIVVLRGAPATIGGEVSVGCPRPRNQLTTRESTAFLTARHALYDLDAAAGRDARSAGG